MWPESIERCRSEKRKLTWWVLSGPQTDEIHIASYPLAVSGGLRFCVWMNEGKDGVPDEDGRITKIPVALLGVEFHGKATGMRAVSALPLSYTPQC
jgi:hypothetical protein